MDVLTVLQDINNLAFEHQPTAFDLLKHEFGLITGDAAWSGEQFNEGQSIHSGSLI
jgi:hypothetical protein